MVLSVPFAVLATASSVGAITIQQSSQTLLSGGLHLKSHRYSASGYTDTPDQVYKWMQQNFPSVRQPPKWDNKVDSESNVYWQHAKDAWEMKYQNPTLNPWVNEYNEDFFLNYIVPITHFDEKAEAWMRFMRDAFRWRMNEMMQKKSVWKNVTLKQVAQFVVENVWTSFGEPPITFKANQTPGILNPLSEVIVKRHASCTAMSIFLSDALRSMGVPSRVVGTAQWNRDQGGNHNWVEAYFDSQWNFIDAAPGVTWWNTAWFTEDGSAQKSEPNGITQIATPVWNRKLQTTKYYVGWDKAGGKWANEAGDSHAYLEIPAIDRTEWYKARPLGKAVQSRCRFTHALSVVQMLAMVLALW